MTTPTPPQDKLLLLNILPAQNEPYQPVIRAPSPSRECLSKFDKQVTSQFPPKTGPGQPHPGGGVLGVL